MKLFIRAALALLLATGGAAQAGVSVSYVDPGRFSDLPYPDADGQRILKDLSAHFEQLARRLPPGQELKLDISDIDLAGRIDPFYRGNNEIRVLRGLADWPRLQLHYALQADGREIRSGEASLSDMNYLQRLNRYAQGDRLRYEKRMIDDWFDATFGPAARR